jgi:hypothetical protein
MKRILFVLIAVVLVAAPAFAQFETGTVVGTIKDSTGAVVPGAKVTLTNTQTGVTNEKTSDANGSYEFFTVRPGTYVITGEKEGFSIALVDNVQVTVGARQRVDLNMAVGQLSEKIEVSASAVLLQTDSSDRSQVITGEQTKALPLNGREYSALALLSPGVRLSALNTGGFTPREGSFNVNGLRSTFNNFLIDGVDNNAYGTSNQGFSNQVMQPAPDAVGEFKVVTNNMSADDQRRLRQRHEHVPRLGVGIHAAHRAERHRLLPAGDRRQTRLRSRSIRRRARWSDQEEQGVLLRGCRDFRSDAQPDDQLHDRHHGTAPRHPGGGCEKSFHR